MALLTNDIYVGSVSDPLYHFTNADVELGGFNGSFALDVIGNELKIDQFTVTVRMTEDYLYDALYDSADLQLFDSAGRPFFVLIDAEKTTLRDLMDSFEYGTPVWWYVAGEFYAKGYIKSVDRVSKYGFKFTCVSGVGLLDTPMHTGGVYENTSIPTVLASIIGGAFTYTVSAAVAADVISGRLPYDTRRNNLHRLLFATGAALMKGDDSNDYVIDYLPANLIDIPPSRISIRGSVNYQLPSNKVEVTEHAFFVRESQPTETLFDTGDVIADNQLVVFDDAVVVSTLATTGTLTVSESGANYAIVNGLGTLTGKYYVHTKQIVQYTENPDNAPDRVRHVSEDCELITALNSYNVIRRVMNYYHSSKVVKAKLLTQGERCGQLLRMTDAFGDLTEAYLSRMDSLVTSVIGADCQLIEGYTPGNNGNYYNDYLIVTEDDIVNGTWNVPQALRGKKARIVLFSGAQGGQGGWYGSGMGTAEGKPSSGISVSTQSLVYVGDKGDIQKGFAGGAGGHGGKAAARILNIDISELANSYSVTLGEGGEGGEGGTAVRPEPTYHPTGVTYTAPQDGQLGEDSVFGSYSTASGVSFEGTYSNMITGEVLATSGDDGEAGADGGDGGASETYRVFDTLAEAQAYSYASAGRGKAGKSFGSFEGGGGVDGGGGLTPFNNTSGEYARLPRKYIVFGLPGGAGGGGAAAGGVGNVGTVGHSGAAGYSIYGMTVTTYYVNSVSTITGESYPDGYFTRVNNCSLGGDGGDVSVIPPQAIFTGGKGGYGGGGGGGAGQCIGKVTIQEGAVTTREVGMAFGGKGGNGGKGGKGSNGFFVVYFRT